MGRDAELADDQHVERCMEASSDGGGDGNAATRKSEHDRMLRGQVRHSLRELLAGVAPITKPRTSPHHVERTEVTILDGCSTAR